MTPSPFAAGLGCRCPACGEGALYAGLLTVRDTCAVCGLDLKGQDTGDGAAFFVMLVVGALTMVLWALVENAWSPPPLVPLAYLVPVVGLLSIAFLRPVKAFLLAQQYRHRVGGFDR